MSDLGALILRLEKATEGSSALDEDIALATGIWKAWLSKHRYWNFTGPDGASFSWPQEGIAQYDSETGKKIVLTEKPWHGWGDDRAAIPAYTSSIDAALTLVPKGCDWSLQVIDRDDRLLGKSQALVGEHLSQAAPDNPAIACCIAALRARSAGKG